MATVVDMDTLPIPTADITAIRGMAVGTTIGTTIAGVMIMMVGPMLVGVMAADGVMKAADGTVAADIHSPMKDTAAGTITADVTA
jgi:ethanolamine utilization microcompartment shell protein EutL